MNILIVKLSSLGDVVHAMPAVQDIRRALPHARVDWVVERGFAPLVRLCEGVRRVVPCELRRWRASPFAGETRAAWSAFSDALREEAYDAVMDLQGLTKSALVSRVAALSAKGRRYAMANRTEGSSYEAPTRWVADRAVWIEPHVHAVQRSRELCAKALGYAVPAALDYGLARRSGRHGERVGFIHGTSRSDKCWPVAHWVDLGRRLVAEGHGIALPHGSDAEEATSRAIAQGIGDGAQVWPRMPLDVLTQRLAECAGAIGVDSGLSHIAVALDLPHVQLYNFDTAWRTGPLPGARRQRSVFAQPSPSVQQVLESWRAVEHAR